MRGLVRSVFRVHFGSAIGFRCAVGGGGVLCGLLDRDGDGFRCRRSLNGSRFGCCGRHGRCRFRVQGLGDVVVGLAEIGDLAAEGAGTAAEIGGLAAQRIRPAAETGDPVGQCLVAGVCFFQEVVAAGDFLFQHGDLLFQRVAGFLERIHPAGGLCRNLVAGGFQLFDLGAQGGFPLGQFPFIFAGDGLAGLVEGSGMDVLLDLFGGDARGAGPQQRRQRQRNQGHDQHAQKDEHQRFHHHTTHLSEADLLRQHGLSAPAYCSLRSIPQIRNRPPETPNSPGCRP